MLTKTACKHSVNLSVEDAPMNYQNSSYSACNSRSPLPSPTAVAVYSLQPTAGRIVATLLILLLSLSISSSLLLAEDDTMKCENSDHNLSCHLQMNPVIEDGVEKGSLLIGMKSLERGEARTFRTLANPEGSIESSSSNHVQDTASKNTFVGTHDSIIEGIELKDAVNSADNITLQATEEGIALSLSDPIIAKKLNYADEAYQQAALACAAGRISLSKIWNDAGDAIKAKALIPPLEMEQARKEELALEQDEQRVRAKESFAEARQEWLPVSQAIKAYLDNPNAEASAVFDAAALFGSDTLHAIEGPDGKSAKKMNVKVSLGDRSISTSIRNMSIRDMSAIMRTFTRDKINSVFLLGAAGFASAAGIYGTRIAHIDTYGPYCGHYTFYEQSICNHSFACPSYSLSKFPCNYYNYSNFEGPGCCYECLGQGYTGTRAELECNNRFIPLIVSSVICSMIPTFIAICTTTCTVGDIAKCTTTYAASDVIAATLRRCYYSHCAHTSIPSQDGFAEDVSTLDRDAIAMARTAINKVAAFCAASFVIAYSAVNAPVLSAYGAARAARSVLLTPFSAVGGAVYGALASPYVGAYTASNFLGYTKSTTHSATDAALALSRAYDHSFSHRKVPSGATLIMLTDAAAQVAIAAAQAVGTDWEEETNWAAQTAQEIAAFNQALAARNLREESPAQGKRGETTPALFETSFTESIAEAKIQAEEVAAAATLAKEKAEQQGTSERRWREALEEAILAEEAYAHLSELYKVYQEQVADHYDEDMMTIKRSRYNIELKRAEAKKAYWMREVKECQQQKGTAEVSPLLQNEDSIIEEKL